MFSVFCASFTPVCEQIPFMNRFLASFILPLRKEKVRVTVTFESSAFLIKPSFVCYHVNLFSMACVAHMKVQNVMPHIKSKLCLCLRLLMALYSICTYPCYGYFQPLSILAKLSVLAKFTCISPRSQRSQSKP